MSEWINVKDALPEHHGEVFVQHINGKIFAAYINSDGRWTRLSDGKNLGCSFYIKCWYKPDPPKQEGPFYASGIHEEMICYRPGDGTCSDWPLLGECKDTIECLANWLNDIIQRKYKKVNDPEPPKLEGPFNFTDDAIEYTENGKVVAVLNVLAPAGWAMKDIIEWVNEVLVTTN